MVTDSVHRLKISLGGIRPPIWRRVEVPSDFNLEELHWVIQVAFEWDDAHLWSFYTPLGRFGGGDYFGEPMRTDDLPAASATVSSVIPRKGDRIRYTYDFGDSWEHDILVEEVVPADPTVTYPQCVAGRRSAPPEDCGGIWRYGYLLEVLADPDHPEHNERLDWLGMESARELDPDAFDRKETSKALAMLRREP